MKKLIIAFVVLAAAAGGWYFYSAAQAGDKDIKDENGIIFFYQTTCGHCHEAESWIKENFPDLEMNRINIAYGNGTQLIIKHAGRHGIALNQLGTPLISMGDNYIMGWTTASQSQFRRFLREMNAKNKPE